MNFKSWDCIEEPTTVFHASRKTWKSPTDAESASPGFPSMSTWLVYKGAWRQGCWTSDMKWHAIAIGFALPKIKLALQKGALSVVRLDAEPAFSQQENTDETPFLGGHGQTNGRQICMFFQIVRTWVVWTLSLSIPPSNVLNGRRGAHALCIGRSLEWMAPLSDGRSCPGQQECGNPNLLSREDVLQHEEPVQHA